MNEELRSKADMWMSLERKTLEQRKLADDYYENNLMKPITEDYIERNQDSLYEKVNYLVVSVGISYEPIVLNINLFQPKKVLFPYDEEFG